MRRVLTARLREGNTEGCSKSEATLVRPRLLRSREHCTPGFGRFFLKNIVSEKAGGESLGYKFSLNHIVYLTLSKSF